MSKAKYTKFSVALEDVSSKIPSCGITIKDFLDLMGERGGLILCMVLAAPFLIPVSIPGSSIPFGIGILFIGISRIFNRYLIPKQVMNYKLSKSTLIKILNSSESIFSRFEKFIKPRILILTANSTINRVNSVLLAFNAFLLMLPLPVPLTDSLPAYSIFFLAAGILEGDGYLILASYSLSIITTIYFSLVFLLGYEGISVILSHFGL